MDLLLASFRSKVLGNRAVELMIVGIDPGKIVIANVIQLVFSFPNKEIMEYYTNSDVRKDFIGNFFPVSCILINLRKGNLSFKIPIVCSNDT